MYTEKFHNILFHMSFIEIFFRPSLMLPLGIPDQTLALSVMRSNKKRSLFLQGGLTTVAQQKE